ncbi:GntR family transcriptional regulator [Litorilinea aerophila]|nr:GntR family transcriptional regulator [Litorilinea aerophila]MCC9074699.1 GntR family transcriptional regulator [Litorilinea aerophila]GIV75875.1 MAG: GntR family transcriptional regulator [Litorilinea sp.]
MLPTTLLAASTRQRGTNESLNELAYRQIRHQILHLELPPASLLDETDLATALGIGLTPVRHALRRLAWEKLVVIMPRRGTMVADVNLSDLRKLFEMQLELFSLAASLAAQRATPTEIQRMVQICQAMQEKTDQIADWLWHQQQLHELLTAASHNEFLAETLSWQFGHTIRLSNLAADTLQASLDARTAELARLLQAVQERMPQEAAALARTYLAHLHQDLVSYF